MYQAADHHNSLARHTRVSIIRWVVILMTAAIHFRSKFVYRKHLNALYAFIALLMIAPMSRAPAQKPASAPPE